MIEEKEELQGQLIASGNIVASMVSQKGAKGDPGEPGSPGEDGFSPIITTSKDNKTTTLTIVDAEGTKTATILDGNDGATGQDGQDGFSPIANISKTGKVATITITDSQGTTTAEIRDGEDGSGSGDMLKSTYDTDNNGIVDNAEKVNNHTVLSDVPANAVFTDTTYTAGTNVSISAQNVISATDTTYTAGTGIDITNGVISNTQTSAEWGNISGTLADQTDLKNALDAKGTYSKPSGGIPKTDLASAVQTSLGKADTAIQSSDLATVATTGDYDDLIDKPTIPTKVSDLTNDSGFITRTVNNLTNYTPSSAIDMYFSTYDTFLANKQKKVISQNTQPSSATTGDLWIDTSDDNRLKYYDGTNWIDVNGQITGDTLPIGSIIPYGSSTAPTNWLVCDGSAVSRTTYAELFAVIGTSYGAGDGSTTFNLPNKKGKVSVGYDSNDTNFNAIGKTGGEKTHQLTEQELPNITGSWTIHGQENGTIFYNATGKATGNVISNKYKGIQDTPTGANSLSSPGFNFGGNQAHNNLQPYETDCWIIKAFQSAGVIAEVSNTQSDSATDTYSCDYINNKTGIVLFNDNDGKNTDIILNDSAANYNYIEIYFRSNDNAYSYTKVDTPNGKKVALDIMHPTATTQSSVYLKTKEVTISGSQITNGYYGEIGLSNASQVIENGNNYIYITKVVGYK